MIRRTKITLAAVTVAAFLAAPALADDLTAYVVHGIPGDDFDLGLEESLPVDVFVSGVGEPCAIPNFQFGDRVGPLTLPAGTYDIRISLADEVAPCEGTVVINLPGVELPAGVNATVIAHRTADGSAGAGDELGIGVTASIFVNDFTPTGPGRGRLIAHHTALAPTVDVVVSRDYSDPDAQSVTVPGFTNPTADADMAISQINAEFRPGDWDVALEVEGTTVFGPDVLKLKPFTATYVYAVGDFFRGNFQYLVYTEDGLKRTPASEAAPSRGASNNRGEAGTRGSSRRGLR